MAEGPEAEQASEASPGSEAAGEPQEPRTNMASGDPQTRCRTWSPPAAGRSWWNAGVPGTAQCRVGREAERGHPGAQTRGNRSGGGDPLSKEERWRGQAGAEQKN